jgi:DNA-binding response OmpR family regulator
MKLLIADDDPITRRQVEVLLAGAGDEIHSVGDGDAAWQILQQRDAPRLAVLDWLMPGQDGVTICRKLRDLCLSQPVYTILLTGRTSKEDTVLGLTSGANDYVTKPFDAAELRARVNVGKNVVQLQRQLVAKVNELERALSEIHQLRRLLPICSYCRRVRDDQNYWQQIDEYFMKHSELRFSHGVCPQCWRTEVEPQLEELKNSKP